MKILVVSDSHGFDTFLMSVIDRVKPIDLFIHCGDYGDFDEYAESFTECPVELVSGNCDYCSPYPGETLISLEGHKLFVTHGHAYGVKGSLDRLGRRAKELGADVALFGHTHMPELREVDGVTLLNPGSISLPRQNGRQPSFAIIELDSRNEIHFTIKYVE